MSIFLPIENCLERDTIYFSPPLPNQRMVHVLLFRNRAQSPKEKKRYRPQKIGLAGSNEAVIIKDRCGIGEMWRDKARVASLNEKRARHPGNLFVLSWSLFSDKSSIIGKYDNRAAPPTKGIGTVKNLAWLTRQIRTLQSGPASRGEKRD